MTIHAHPDDESSQTGGTLARYAAAGWRTVLVTCTDGRQGDGPRGVKPGQSGHDPLAVAQQRSRELGLATIALDIDDLVELSYPDSGDGSGRQGSRGSTMRTFAETPLTVVADRLERVMRRVRPDVVITYPPNGLSGHPDHVHTHDATMLAHRRVVRTGGFQVPDSHGVIHTKAAPSAYYIAVSETTVRLVRQQSARSLGDDAWLPPTEMSIPDADVTTAIDVTDFRAAKLRALSAHTSQADATAIFRALSAADPALRRLHVEEYVQAYPDPGARRRAGIPDPELHSGTELRAATANPLRRTS